MLRKFYCMILSICILLISASCSQNEKEIAKSNEQLSEEFSKVWIERWNLLEEKDMLLPNGKIFYTI